LSIEDLLHASEEPAAACFERPPLGVGKRVERELEDVERGLELVHPVRDFCGPVTEGGRALVGRAGGGGPRVPEQSFPGEGIRRLVGEEEGLGLPGGEAVTLRRVGQPLLLALSEREEGQGHGEGQPAAVEARGEVGREFRGEGEPALHPGLSLPEEPRDGEEGEPVLVDERGDDPRLVHGTQRPARLVGGEKSGLPRRPADGLDDDVDLESAVGPEPREPLEAVEHLVGAVVAGGDADGQRSERARRIGVLAAQPGEGGAQALDRDEEDGAHRSPRGKSRTWKSG
jgi:hypothetical protein